MSLVFRGIGRERQGEGVEKSEDEQGGMNHVREFWSVSSKEFNADEERDESEFPRIKSRIFEAVKRCKWLFFSLLKLVKLIFSLIDQSVCITTDLFYIFILLYLFHYAANISDMIGNISDTIWK